MNLKRLMMKEAIIFLLLLIAILCFGNNCYAKNDYPISKELYDKCVESGEKAMDLQIESQDMATKSSSYTESYLYLAVSKVLCDVDCLYSKVITMLAVERKHYIDKKTKSPNAIKYIEEWLNLASETLSEDIAKSAGDINMASDYPKVQIISRKAIESMRQTESLLKQISAELVLVRKDL